MKTKRVLRKILSAGFLLALLIIVVMSCKKKDDTPDPTPPGPGPTPPPITTPDVFANKPLQLMTDWEITHNQPFAGHYFRSLGRGLVGGEDPEIPFPFKEVGKTLWEIHNYLHTEKEFKEIDNNLKLIQNQLNQLEGMISTIGTEIQLQTTQLESFFTVGSVNTAMEPLTTALDSTGPSNFGYYPVTARRSSSDSINYYAAMVSNSKYLPTYANLQILPPGGGLPVMETFITSLSSLLSAPAPGYDGCLHTYNRQLINSVQAQYTNGMDSSTAMKAYQILENYFMWIVGAQFQAENILINCSNVIDSTNTLHLAESQWIAFQPIITAEIGIFLGEVDFFVANLDEYRTMPRWTSDVQYADAGLAPDNVFINVLARAQFLANSLYDGFKLKYPVMCGKIITPYYYTYDGGTQSTTSLSLNSTKPLSSTAVQVTSWIPNTIWPSVNNNVSTCDYSFDWSVFTFGTMGKADSGWQSTNPMTISFTDAYHPWAHSSAPGGTVKVMFHNPQDLNDVASSYDTVHSMPFGYFSANWKWGFMYLRYDNENWHQCGAWCSEQLQTNVFNYPNNSMHNCDGKGTFSATSPYVVGLNSNWEACTQSAYQGYFTVNSGGYQVGLSEMAYNGPAYNWKAGNVAYAFNMYNTIQAARTIQSNTAWFAWQAASWYNFGTQLNCNGGVGYKKLPNMESGTNINSTSFYQIVNKSQNWTTTIGVGGNFNSGVQMQVNFGFDLFFNQIVPSYNLAVLFHPNTTVIFGGMGSPPK
ncbi:MAG: hypothetical protein NT004_04395 [Bacteroidetes bacterium]|nr:hypothetical protein [Bacteroidota bacterium]